MARKSEALPRYSESVVERGFDNVEMVERLRYSGGGRRRFVNYRRNLECCVTGFYYAFLAWGMFVD